MTPKDLRPVPMFGGVAGPLIIAHRGGSLEAPENTLAALRHAVQVGADWQEIDVTLTSDGHAVVIHDDSLERTTDGKGEVGARTLAELRAMRAGRPTWNDEQKAQLRLFGVEPPDFGARFESERIPTLEEVLALPDTRLMIELKRIGKDRTRELARAVVEAVREAKAWDRVALGSFDEELLWAVHDLEPSVPLIGIAKTDGEIRTMLGLPIAVLAVRVDHVASARELAHPGIAVWAWTIYSMEMAHAAVDQGARGLITDVPSVLVGELRKPPELYVEEGDGG